MQIKLILVPGIVATISDALYAEGDQLEGPILLKCI